MQIEPWKRPRFADLVHSLEAMKYSALMKVILMDLSRLDFSSTTPAVSTDTAMDREALENILGMTHPWSFRLEEFVFGFGWQAESTKWTLIIGERNCVNHGSWYHSCSACAKQTLRFVTLTAHDHFVQFSLC